MEEDRGRRVERLLTLTDAVVAIAITLLALPLIEIDRSAVSARGLIAVLDDDQWLRYVGLLISFFVIARLWWGHHRIFEHVQRWNPLLLVLNLLWLFTIVLLPIATALSTTASPDEHVDIVAVYLANIVVSSVLLTAMSVVVLRRPALTDGEDTEALRRLIASADTTLGFLLALVIGTAFPVINYFAFLVLAFTGRLGGFVHRRIERRHAASASLPR